MQQFGTRQPLEFEEKSSGGLKVTIVVFAIFLFALSGLMMGLAVGAFTRHQQNPTPQQSNVAQQKAQTTPTPNANIAQRGIACPIFNPTFSETADGATDYQLSATLEDTSISKNANSGCGSGNLLKVSGITCKIWVTNNSDVLKSLTKDDFQPAANMQNTFPDEILGAVTFTSGQRVQDCSPTGVTSWSYKLSPTLKSGNYFLAVAADWQGQSWNWSWREITVKGA
jgi:hypothetical protein